MTNLFITCLAYLLDRNKISSFVKNLNSNLSSSYNFKKEISEFKDSEIFNCVCFQNFDFNGV